ncbi:Asp-tRNA(Asn)/Glu-tRNA(Gln) amidotransferase subunit GatC [Candidatus Wolfebacteria bacterium]|nr:Asp-tRNA(Asn)/Glu-tRNA(Gln) amidotransferase subunit GatC [Candidatus Wolfebacteria bacterium]
MVHIDKKMLEYLAELARIDITGMDEEKLAKDLEAILAYFEELKEVDTEGVEPMAGGTMEVNIVRDDEPTTNDQSFGAAQGKQPTTELIEAFPEREGDFLKVPPIFSD